MKDGRHAAVDSSDWTTVWTRGASGGPCPDGWFIQPESQELHVRLEPFQSETVEAYANNTSTSVAGATVVPSTIRRLVMVSDKGAATALKVRAAAGSTTFLVDRFNAPRPAE